MSLKCISCLKRVSEERDPPLDSGYIGKSVPLTPTFLGIFVLNQFYSKKFSHLSADLRPVSRDTNRKNSQKIILVCEK